MTNCSLILPSFKNAFNKLLYNIIINSKDVLCSEYFSWQVSSTYADGYRLTAVCPVGGPRAKAKAQQTAEEIIKR